MGHDLLQAPFVGAQHGVEDGLALAVEDAMFLLMGPTEEAAGKHGRKGQGDESRDEDGDADSDSKLMQQPSYESAHEQDGNKDGGQRDSHGDDGEADFASAFYGRLIRTLAHLHVADNIFEHDDGIVDDKTHGEREGHQ